MIMLGIDVGAVSLTAALLTDSGATPKIPGFDISQTLPGGQTLLLSEYQRTRGRPTQTAQNVINAVQQAVGDNSEVSILFTGGAAATCAKALGGEVVNEFRAISAGLGGLDIPAKCVFEMGGETSKYLELDRNDDGSYSIVNYSTNGDCAAGTGSFIDQQANRLKLAVEEVGDLCLQAGRTPQVAGRCSVFAKSDMIHAQQKGYSPAEVMRGLCVAVARNFKTAVVRSHVIESPVVLLGGVTANSAVVDAMRETFELRDGQLHIPEYSMHILAVGVAILGSQVQKTVMDSSAASTSNGFPAAEPLSLDNVLMLRDVARTSRQAEALLESPSPASPALDVYLGIDIGSVSTNLVLLDEDGCMVEEIYTRTQGRPIEVVADGLRRLEAHWGDRIQVRGVGATGSGRELIGQLIGADTINDEITAHKTGATFIGETLLDGRRPDTIFEIGGQDSKYISLQDGVVVDFTMNEACAAGTGSFLEERADELDVAIKGEFADMALASETPIRLGERCTVFMERDVNSYLHRGAEKPDLLAGLAYSVVQNYINRVVRGRKIGDCIFFQGGTAYNDATAAAFAAVTGKEIIVPPHNGVMGAIGAALLAKEKMAGNGVPSRTASTFRGFDLGKVHYDLKEFTCEGCSNLCQIQQFTVEGEKTYWGDKCSEKFRKRAKSSRQPVIDDLFAFRMKRLFDESDLPETSKNALTIGIPRTMFAWNLLPFWQTMLSRLGCRVVLSDPTNQHIIKAGLGSVVAEPCFPIIVAHGHVANLLEKEPDFVFLPNIISQETPWMHTEAHLCPWHQTLPFVVRRCPQIASHAEKFLTPLVSFSDGRAVVSRLLSRYLLNSPLAKHLKLSGRKVAQAVAAGYAAQDCFAQSLIEKGAEAMQTLTERKQPGVVLIGRPYNVHDAGMNLSVARKLRDHYGVNVIPLDMLDLDAVDIRPINPNMYWDLGRRIIAAATIVGRHENLHMIHITNFKCGPDSFIKHFIGRACGEPYLTLQFDGHSNDAGMMTRCEAYLDSRGLLR